MLTDIPKNLHQYFTPQIEQLEMRSQQHRLGLSASMSPDKGEGGIWVASLDDDCLFTVLDISLHESELFDSHFDDYFCLGEMSTANLCGTPLANEQRIQNNNLVTFYQQGGTFSYSLKKDAPYTSRSLCVTPSFFTKIKKYRPEDADILLERLSSPTLNELPLNLGALFQSINPEDADLPGAEWRLRSLVSSAIGCLLDTASAQDDATKRAGSISSKKLVIDACAIMEKHFAKALTIEKMAADLCVSRASLAAIFKEETGMSVGEHLRAIRMKRAAQLLHASHLSIAQIASAVGYARQSSFSEAFRREFGISPSKWRGKIKR